MWSGNSYDDEIDLEGDSLKDLADPVFDEEKISEMTKRAKAQKDLNDGEYPLCFVAKRGALLGKLYVALDEYLIEENQKLNESLSVTGKKVNLVGILQVGLVPGGPVVVRRCAGEKNSEKDDGKSLR